MNSTKTDKKGVKFLLLLTLFIIIGESAASLNISAQTTASPGKRRIKINGDDTSSAPNTTPAAPREQPDQNANKPPQRRTLPPEPVPEEEEEEVAPAPRNTPQKPADPNLETPDSVLAEIERKEAAFLAEEKKQAEALRRIRHKARAGAEEQTALQINGYENKYGEDNITDTDMARLRATEISASTKFLVNGTDGKYVEAAAPNASELALTAKKESTVDSRSSTAGAAGANRNVSTSDLIAAAAGRDLGGRSSEPGQQQQQSQIIGKRIITTRTTTTYGNGVRNTGSSSRSLAGTSRGITPEIAAWTSKYGRMYGVDPLLIIEVMRQESSFNPRAGSPVGAYGLMQFMPGTAARFGINAWDPEQAILGGAKYLAFLLRRYGGNLYSALAGYNAGEGAVDCFLTGRTLRLSNGKTINSRGSRTMHGVPPYAETQNYVKVISANYFRYYQK